MEKNETPLFRGNIGVDYGITFITTDRAGIEDIVFCLQTISCKLQEIVEEHVGTVFANTAEKYIGVIQQKIADLQKVSTDDIRSALPNRALVKFISDMDIDLLLAAGQSQLESSAERQDIDDLLDEAKKMIRKPAMKTEYVTAILCQFRGEDIYEWAKSNFDEISKFVAILGGFFRAEKAILEIEGRADKETLRFISPGILGNQIDEMLRSLTGGRTQEPPIEVEV